MKYRVYLGLMGILFAMVLGGCVRLVDDVYAGCIDSSDCSAFDQCFEVDLRASTENTFGALCTHGCDADFDCESNNGFSGACYALQDDANTFCFQRCDLDFDCDFSSVCISVSLPGGAVDGVCVPDNG